MISSNRALTVVVVAHNEARTLLATVERVYRALIITVEDFAIIVFDDGSSDDYVPADNTWPLRSFIELFGHLAKADVVTSYSNNLLAYPVEYLRQGSIRAHGFGFQAEALLKAVKLCATILALPANQTLSRDDIIYVSDEIRRAARIRPLPRSAPGKSSWLWPDCSNSPCRCEVRPPTPRRSGRLGAGGAFPDLRSRCAVR